MRRKILKHFADIFCKMFVGWRIGDDIEKIVTLPDNIILTVDVLKGTLSSDPKINMDLSIVSEMHAWFIENSNKHHVDLQKIKTAVLIAKVIKIPYLKGKVKGTFSFHCESIIQTDEREYTSVLIEKGNWSFE